MPIVVDPGFAWPPEVDPVVSPDGRLTAIVDPAHAGVLLRADFDDSVPDTPAQPEKVLRRNLEVGFGSMLSSWTTQSSATATLSPGAGESGKNAVKFTVGSNPANLVFFYQNSIVPISPGEWAGFGVSVKNDVGAPYFALRILFVNSSGATVGSSPYVGSVLQASSSYARTFGAAQAPATAVGFRAYSYIRQSTDPGAPLANQSVLVSSWSVDIAATEEGAANSVETHFTGSTAASGTKRYRWAGTANASASEEFTPATPFVPGHGATVAKVRFERQDGSVVRSGNPAWAPGGYAHAYDHEATLGGGTLWRAVPIRFDGTEGEPSEYVGAVIPPLSDGWAWLKPVTDPDKAMLLKVEPPDLSYDGRVDTTSIAGAPRPAATWDVLEGFTTQLRSLVREKNVEEQLMALLDEGPVLAQFPACAGLPDFYFIRGKLDLEHVHWDGWPWRRYQWDVIQIDRPDTTDSPLRIPGLSYDTVARDWTTYDQLKSTVESYNKLLEP